MTAPITFMIEGDPVQWARAGRNGRFSFTPKKQAVHMDVIRLAASRVFKGVPIEGPIELAVSFIYEWPKSLSEKKRKAPGAHYKTSRPDADNLIKIIADALNKIMWHDDAQIVQSRFSKQYGLTSATYVSVTPLVSP